jgi:hypothetical protein
MADDVEIELDSNLEKKLHEYPIVLSKAGETAEKIAKVARENAPVMTGAYRDGITVQRSNNGNGVWRVFASDPKSSWIEFGAPGRNIPGQYVIRSAAEMLGYTFKKSR